MPLIIEPIDLNKDDENIVASILDNWIENAMESRIRMEESWLEDLRAYEGRPKVENKNWPWPGAANIEIPLKAIVTDVIQENLHQNIFGQGTLWSVVTEDEDPEVNDFTNDISDFINFEVQNRMHITRPSRDWMFEAILLGTGWSKGSWVDIRRLQKISRQGAEPKIEEVFDHYGPLLEAIPIEDILVPPRTRTVNGPFRCQFISHVAHLRWDELKEREQQGYKNLDTLEHVKVQAYRDQMKEERDRLMDIEYIRQEELPVHEVWCKFPVHELSKFPDRKIDMEDGKESRDFVELIITYHKDTRTVLRCIENWNEIGTRPFFPLQYIRRANSVYGQGIGRALHYLVDGVNTVHNQRLDNATVANTRFWGVRKGTVPRGTRISPSMVMHLDNPKEDIVALAHGDVYTSSHVNEQALKHYIDLRSGVDDYQSGREAQGQYQATATSTMRLLEKGQMKWDFTIDDWREVFGELGQWLLSQYRQYGYHYTGVLESEFGMAKAERIRKALEVQAGKPTFSLYKFDLVVTRSSTSKEAEVQKSQMLFDLTERFYIQSLALLGQATRGVDEAGVPITISQKTLIFEAITAGFALYKRILHSFDVKDVETFLPDLKKVLEAAKQDEQVQAQQQQQAMAMEEAKEIEKAEGGQGAGQPRGGGPARPTAGPTQPGGASSPARPRRAARNGPAPTQ